MSLSRDDEPGIYERTMLVDVRQVRPKKDWKPYRFPNLERVDRTQTGLSARAQRLLPLPSAVETLGTRLKVLFDAEPRFSLVSVQIRPATELRRHLGDVSFLCVVAPGAMKSRVILEVELQLAHAVVDMLLGGAGETVGLRPLTDIEEGVLGFVLLEGLKALAPGLEEGQPKPRMEGVTRGVDEAAARLIEDGPVLVAQLRARLGAQEGMVRLFLPAGVLEAMEPAQAAEQRRVQLRTDAQAHLSRLSSARAWLRAEIGYASAAIALCAGLSGVYHRSSG